MTKSTRARSCQALHSASASTTGANTTTCIWWAAQAGRSSVSRSVGSRSRRGGRSARTHQLGLIRLSSPGIRVSLPVRIRPSRFGGRTSPSWPTRKSRSRIKSQRACTCTKTISCCVGLPLGMCSRWVTTPP